MFGSSVDRELKKHVEGVTGIQRSRGHVSIYGEALLPHAGSMAPQAILILVRGDLSLSAIHRYTRYCVLGGTERGWQTEGTGWTRRVRSVAVNAGCVPVLVENDRLSERVQIVGVGERVARLLEVRQDIENRLHQVRTAVVANEASLRSVVHIRRTIRILAQYAWASGIVRHVTTLASILG